MASAGSLGSAQSQAQPAVDLGVPLLLTPIVVVALMFFAGLVAPDATTALTIISVLAAVIVLSTAVMAYRETKGGFENADSPLAVFFTLLLIWAVSYPAYLHRRRRLGLQSRLWPGLAVTIVSVAGMLLAPEIPSLRSPDVKEMEAGIVNGLNAQLTQQGAGVQAKSVMLLKESAHRFSGLVTFAEGGQAKVTVTTEGQKYIWEVDKASLAEVAAQQALKQAMTAAEESARMKRTGGDLISLGTCAEAYAVDYNKYPLAADLDSFERLVVPTYIRKLPREDGWGTAFRYVVDPAQQHYRVASAGSDKVFDPRSLDLSVPPAGLTREPGRDIILEDGAFKQYPPELEPR